MLLFKINMIIKIVIKKIVIFVIIRLIEMFAKLEKRLRKTTAIN